MARRSRAVQRIGLSFAVAFWMLGAVGLASATMKYGPIELSGSVDTQTLMRTSSIDNWQFVQNRNTALIRLDYEWLQKGKFVDRFDVPFIKRSKLYILYRGVYDSFWDIGPGGRQKGVTPNDDYVGGPIVGNRIGRECTTPQCVCATPGCTTLRPGLYTSLSESARDDLKYENRLREAYIDIDLSDIPLNFRLGRQQVIWGESDQFRLMDIINPLDTTWHLQQEDWDKIRIPLWMVKMIWDFGTLGSISNAFAEVVWNPGDFMPGNKVRFLPAPWGIPVPNAVRPGQVLLASPTQPLMLTPLFDLNGTDYLRGDFHRNPGEASDIGFRFHGVNSYEWLQGLEFTVNYLYARSRGIGAAAGAPFGLKVNRITVPSFQAANAFRQNPSDPSSPLASLVGVRAPLYPAQVDAEFVFPYTHIFGATGNYFDGDYTNTVLRFETAYQLGAPFQSGYLKDRVQVEQEIAPGIFEPLPNVYAPVGLTKRDVWAGMIGFDRPTWIRFLNPRTTWFLTGQFFWSAVMGTSSKLRGSVLSADERPYFSPSMQNPIVFPDFVRRTGRVQWGNGIYAGQPERTQDASIATFKDGTGDAFRNIEILTTLAATSFYAGGTIVPFIAIAIDPVNRNFLSQLKCDYFFTNDVIIQGRANFYSNLGSGQNSFDPWGAGGLNHRRDELGLKITYQF
ncbi:MAG: DUF1302 family protein [Candidatus Binatia bacterium]